MTPGRMKSAKNCAGKTMNKPTQKSAAPRAMTRGFTRIDVGGVMVRGGLTSIRRMFAIKGEHFLTYHGGSLESSLRQGDGLEGADDVVGAGFGEEALVKAGAEVPVIALVIFV